MTRVAAVDCGTNSIRLLIADVDPATGSLVDLDRRMEIVRLGQGVDRTGRLAPEALERTFAACRQYAEAIAAHEVPAGNVRFVATSASRDASNREDFVNGVRGILGVEPEVITGAEEARLSFTGATRELGEDTYLVVDIGGGSTEFVLGDKTPRASRSVDIGCVRMTERHLTTEDGTLIDPPPADRVAAIEKDIDAALDEARSEVPFAEASTLVGLAGTVTTLAGAALHLPAYDSSAIHHSTLTREAVEDLTTRFLTSTHATRAAIPVMHPGRVDVITSGTLILRAIMRRVGADRLIVSEHDILDGIAWSVVGE